MASPGKRGGSHTDRDKLGKTQTPGVYKRGDRYVVTWRDHEGKQRRKSQRTYDQARTLKRKMDAAAKDPDVVPERGLTFAQYSAKWVAEYRGTKRGFSEGTRRDYERDLLRACQKIGPILMPDLTSRHIAELIDWLCDEQEQGRWLTDRTVKRILAPVSACLTTAQRDGVIPANPALGVPLPNRFDPTIPVAVPVRFDPDADPDDEDGVDVKILTRGELSRFLAALPEDENDWSLFFECLVASGLRWSEGCAMPWEYAVLDGPKPFIYVCRKYSRGAWGTPKSKYGVRRIRITVELAARLKARRERQAAKAEDLMWPSKSGTPLDPGNVRQRVLAPAARSAGVEWIGFHTFRHTAGSWLLQAGATIPQVCRFLGHHSPQFTARTYLHEDRDGARPALDVQAMIDLPATR